MEIGEEMDIFGVGAILYQCITGELPGINIPTDIDLLNLETNTPSNNFFINLPQFENIIISDQFCYIVMRALSTGDIKFPTLKEFGDALQRQKEQLAKMGIIKQILGHPILKEGEMLNNIDFIRDVDCVDTYFNEFELKYLGKFIYSPGIRSLRLNGCPLPLGGLFSNSLTVLELSNCNLFSEDIYILAKFLFHNYSLTHLNISKNKIGYRQEKRQIDSAILLGVTDRQVVTSENTLGFEHLALALAKNTRLHAIDFAENVISSQNAKYIYI